MNRDWIRSKLLECIDTFYTEVVETAKRYLESVDAGTSPRNADYYVDVRVVGGFQELTSMSINEIETSVTKLYTDLMRHGLENAYPDTRRRRVTIFAACAFALFTFYVNMNPAFVSEAFGVDIHVMKRMSWEVLNVFGKNRSVLGPFRTFNDIPNRMVNGPFRFPY